MAPTTHHNEDWRTYNAAIPFDMPVPAILGLWHAIRPGVDKLIVSGRDGAFAHLMRMSFAKHGIEPTAFFHRPANDRRVDSAVKEQILLEKILPRWEVLYAVDDREQVAQVWEAHGIAVLRVKDPGVERFLTRHMALG